MATTNSNTKKFTSLNHKIKNNEEGITIDLSTNTQVKKQQQFTTLNTKKVLKTPKTEPKHNKTINENIQENIKPKFDVSKYITIESHKIELEIAFKNGHEKAIKELSNKIKNEIELSHRKSVINKIQKTLASLGKDNKTRTQNYKNAIIKLSLSIGQKLSNKNISNADFVKNFMSKIIDDVTTKPRIVVTINRKMKECVQDFLREIKSDSKIEIKFDQTFEEMDCRIEWDEGIAETILQHKISVIENILDMHLSLRDQRFSKVVNKYILE